MAKDLMPEVIEHISCLPHNLQKQVLDYVRELQKTHAAGASGERLLRFAGSISAEDLKIMSEAIEEDCGRIDLNEW